MNQLTLTIPDHLDLDERETKRFLAAKMYESGKLSLGQAAELAGLSKVALSEILADYGVWILRIGSCQVKRSYSARYNGSNGATFGL